MTPTLNIILHVERTSSVVGCCISTHALSVFLSPSIVVVVTTTASCQEGNRSPSLDPRPPLYARQNASHEVIEHSCPFAVVALRRKGMIARSASDSPRGTPYVAPMQCITMEACKRQ